MVFFVSKFDICNFVDNNTISSRGKNLSENFHNLKLDLGNILKWFKVHSLNPNFGKFQIMILEINTNIYK